MSEENIKVITQKEELYEHCENVEQLFDKFYLPLLDIHYRKTYNLQQKVEQLENIKKEAIEELSYMSTDAYVEDYDIREKHYNLLMNILNKGDNNVKDKR